MFEEKYQGLSKSDQNDFEETINELLLTSFVTRTYYDRRANMMKMRKSYSFLEKYFDLVSSYLSFAGFEVIKDDGKGVIFLSSSNTSNRLRLDSVTTLVIFALRYLYEVKLEMNPMKNEINVSMTELKQVLTDKGLFQANKRLTSTSLAGPLRLLNFHHLIEKGKGDFIDRDCDFYILPSICFAMNASAMSLVLEEVDKINKESLMGE